MKTKFSILFLILLAASLIVSKKALLFGECPPRVTVYWQPCDIDRDRDCDRNDFLLFTQVLGQCQDGDNYNELADANHDGCVTAADQQILFQGNHY
ncbi:MAG: dockerin type I domain-containing protein [Patescibacteria group bacterium]